MREIKFRAWVTEDYPRDSVQNTILTHDELSIDGALDGHEVGNVILMQYTGLKDKNGKEVYEGDILGFDKYEWYRAFGADFVDQQGLSDPVFEVKWNNKEARFEVDGTCRDLQRHCEVVGNRFKNPELLEQEAVCQD